MSQQSLQKTSRRIILVQVGLASFTSLVIIAITPSWQVVISALSGGLIAVIATAMSARRVEHASRLAYRHPGLGVAKLYTGATLRFLFVILAFSLGLGVFRLPAGPMILVFAIAQLGFLQPLLEKQAPGHENGKQ